MRGKPIEQTTIDDLRQLIGDGVAEDRRIEFKADVPVSPEEQKAKRKLNPDVAPVDRSWVEGRKLANYGRDEIVAEAVAFANADGGTVIIGMEETEEPPHLAKRLNPLPDVAGLERRLRDVLASCVEPRLPYVAVRALPMEADGAGVVLIEVGSSILGPHWVTTSRRPTVRREDRCDPLSMVEIHDMVLRNARQIDSFRRASDVERAKFIQDFATYLRRAKPSSFLGEEDEAVDAWLSASGKAALGVQVTLTPHFDLAIPRLESTQGLIPASDSISITSGAQERKVYYVSAYNYAATAERILGGVRADQSGGFNKSIRVLRDGRVIVSFMQVREVAMCTCTADLVIGAAGFALGVYDRLRLISSYPQAPADVTLDICARQHVGVGDYDGVGRHGSYGRLAEHVPFPVYTLGDSNDISVLLQEIGADLINAGGMPGSHLPKASWRDPR